MKPKLHEANSVLKNLLTEETDLKNEFKTQNNSF